MVAQLYRARNRRMAGYSTTGIQRATIPRRYVARLNGTPSTRPRTAACLAFALPHRANCKGPTAGWRPDARKVPGWEHSEPGAPEFQTLSRASRYPAYLSRKYWPPARGTLSAALVPPPTARDRRADRPEYKSQPAARLVPQIAIPVFPAKGSAFRNWRCTAAAHPANHRAIPRTPATGTNTDTRDEQRMSRYARPARP